MIDSVQTFLSMDCSYNSVAYGALMQKALNNSWTQLRDTMPIEVIARSIAYGAYVNTYSCNTMVNAVYLN